MKDYHKRASAWSKGVIQDRLGLVTYKVQVGELLWKRHIDQLCELAASKVADVEPNCPELPEIDLFEIPDTSNASVPVSEPDTLQLYNYACYTSYSTSTSSITGTNRS